MRRSARGSTSAPGPSPATTTASRSIARSSRTNASSARTRRWWRRCASRAAPTSARARRSTRTRRPVSSRWRARSRCRFPRGSHRRRRASEMCGIVGAAARRDIVPVLVEGLRRLEYRGYDSCGVAIVEKESIGSVVSVSRVGDLAAQIGRKEITGKTGLAHTRWATHGAPAAENAHPIVSRGEIALVHNGIIENHDELRAELAARGYRFEGQTDTEVVAHLVHSLYGGNLLEAVRAAVKRLTGSYAIAVVARREPGRVVGARDGMPLVVGVGEDECFLASDALALAGTTERIAYLEDGDVAAITDHDWRVFDRAGRPAAREVRVIKATSTGA